MNRVLLLICLFLSIALVSACSGLSTDSVGNNLTNSNLGEGFEDVPPVDEVIEEPSIDNNDILAIPVIPAKLDALGLFVKFETHAIAKSPWWSISQAIAAQDKVFLGAVPGTTEPGAKLRLTRSRLINKYVAADDYLDFKANAAGGFLVRLPDSYRYFQIALRDSDNPLEVFDAYLGDPGIKVKITGRQYTININETQNIKEGIAVYKSLVFFNQGKHLRVQPLSGSGAFDFGEKNSTAAYTQLQFIPAHDDGGLSFPPMILGLDENYDLHKVTKDFDVMITDLKTGEFVPSPNGPMPFQMSYATHAPNPKAMFDMFSAQVVNKDLSPFILVPTLDTPEHEFVDWVLKIQGDKYVKGCSFAWSTENTLLRLTRYRGLPEVFEEAEEEQEDEEDLGEDELDVDPEDNEGEEDLNEEELDVDVSEEALVQSSQLDPSFSAVEFLDVTQLVQKNPLEMVEKLGNGKLEEIAVKRVMLVKNEIRYPSVLYNAVEQGLEPVFAANVMDDNGVLQAAFGHLGKKKIKQLTQGDVDIGPVQLNRMGDFLAFTVAMPNGLRNIRVLHLPSMTSFFLVNEMYISPMYQLGAVRWDTTHPYAFSHHIINQVTGDISIAIMNLKWHPLSKDLIETYKDMEWSYSAIFENDSLPSHGVAVDESGEIRITVDASSVEIAPNKTMVASEYLRPAASLKNP